MSQEVLIGPYRILMDIAVGGTATIFLARHEETGQKVAVKVLDEAEIGDLEARKRTQREFQILRRVDHPNVVKALDYQTRGSCVYLVYNLIEGPNLGELLESGRRFTPRLAFSIVERIVGALALCHELKVFHRDIKPRNIVLEVRTRQPILLDFGIAKDADRTDITRMGSLLGTVGYLTPEQILGWPVDSRTDIFQIGLLLLHLISGEDPADVDMLKGLLICDDLDQIEKLFEKLRLRPRIARLFESAAGQIVSRCLRVSPDQRYPTTWRLLRDLESLLAPIGGHWGSTSPENISTSQRIPDPGPTFGTAILSLHRVDRRRTQEVLNEEFPWRDAHGRERLVHLAKTLEPPAEIISLLLSWLQVEMELTVVAAILGSLWTWTDPGDRDLALRVLSGVFEQRDCASRSKAVFLDRFLEKASSRLKLTVAHLRRECHLATAGLTPGGPHLDLLVPLTTEELMSEYVPSAGFDPVTPEELAAIARDRGIEHEPDSDLD